MHQLIMDFETFFQCPFRQQKDEFSKKIFNFFFRIFSLKIKNFKDNCPGLKNIYTFFKDVLGKNRRFFRRFFKDQLSNSFIFV